MHRRLPPGAILALSLAAASPAAAQESVTVAAGARYEAGALRRLLVGDGYRSTWTAPVRVAVLDPDTFAGGLTLLQRGGGLSTESLRLRGADGREYVFRSVDKNAARGLPEDLQGTVVSAIVQDATSGKHPAAALVVAPLAHAAGVLHATPALYVMPDHPFLGEHRAEFAGMLGQVEERPDEPEEGAAAFAGADRITGSERFLEHLEEHPRNRLAVGEYLTARLLDVVVGDWDRHLDQWRWARFDRDGVRLWRPIPRDRDNALVRHEGLLMAGARRVQPQLVRFGRKLDDVPGLVVHASDLDRRLLAGAEWPAWEAAVAGLRARLDDRTIADAVGRLPAPYRALEGAELEATLRARRDALPDAARRFYALLATEVDVRATDEDETAVVDRHDDGSVEVRIHAGAPEGEPHFRRRFHPEETREVRLFLQGGADRATVRGSAARGPLVRVIGGGGDDVLVDSTHGGRRTVFHDHRGDNVFHPGSGARVDTRAWEEPEREGLFGNPPSPRDWGASFSAVAPVADWRSGVGPVLGAGPVWTRYGFRRRPYARRTAVQALWAPLHGGVGVEASTERIRTGSRGGTRIDARAVTYDAVRFHGYGNRSPDEEGTRFRVPLTRVEAAARASWWPGERTRVSAGPEVRWTDPGTVAAAPGVRGSAAFAQAGAAAEVRWDGRDDPRQPRRGAWARVAGRGYGSGVGSFGGVDGEARGYGSVGEGGPTLALRTGGALAFGDFPLQEAAFVGGFRTLRGYPDQRFAGSAALYGGAELRQRVGAVNLGLARGRLGVTALADGGRVFVDGRSPGGWHTSLGGGLWFETLGRVLTLVYAHGDAGRVYATVGPQF